MTSSVLEARFAQVPDVEGASAVEIRGRVTASVVGQLRQSIVDAIARTPSSKLVLDLGGVDEMDTAGAAVLIEAIQLGRERDLSMFVCSPSDLVIRMFELAGLEDVLDCCCSSPEEMRKRLLAEP